MIKFDMQGHRGCRGLMPENTIAAMKKAVDLGVTTLEMDVVISADGKVVLSHEPFFNHEISTKPDGNPVMEAEEKGLNIYRMNYEEIIKYDVGQKPHPRFPQQQKQAAVKPLLSDLFDSVMQYCETTERSLPQFNIETKTLPTTDSIFHPDPIEFVDILMAVILEKGIGEKTIIQSFDFRTLRYLHKKYPSIKTAMLIEEEDTRTPDGQLKDLGFTPNYYSPYHGLVTKEVITTCHAQGMKVIPWTVNKKEEMQKLIAFGVDGIITDYPNLFADVEN